MKITNKTALPASIVSALTEDNYTKGDSNYSVTQLIDSPRVRILRRMHHEEMEQDASELLWSALGNAVHLMFEKASVDHDDHHAEERLFVAEDGWVLSGAIDLQVQEKDGSVTIVDYKCTSVWSVIFGKEDWVKQLNCYAWLVRKAKGINVNAVKIIAVLRDWKWRDASMKPDYPEAPIVEVEIPLWTEEFVDGFIKGRVFAHQEAEFIHLSTGELPECDAEERWEKPTTYAVKKNKNIRAVRVFKSAKEADEFIMNKDEKGLWVEQRKGESTRCEQNYCGVSQFCNQYQKAKAVEQS
jgi:hypothetical protein